VAEGGIRLRGVAKGFRRRDEHVQALEGVDLDIDEGQFVAVIGPSGCGKSTLLRLVAGLTAPDAGTVAVAGRSPDEARRAKWFGLVPQTPALLPWRTARANIGLLGEVNRRGALTGGEGHLIPVDAGTLLTAVGLDGFEEALPHQLSGGMQQRVALARAFALGAPVLLMDEPFAALDELTRDEMRYLLLSVWEGSAAPGRSPAPSARPRTVLFVTHGIDEAVLLADRVIVLSRRPGRVAEDLAVDLPRPRPAGVVDSDRFIEQTRLVRAALRRAIEA